MVSMHVKHHESSQKEVTRTPSPPLFRVVLLNDDFTPMEFVVFVLKRFFLLSAEDATRIMLQIHHDGAAVAGVYSRDIAETRAQKVADYAQSHQHPLQCVVEADG
ncbi:MAG: ATP-dependent Clp protease adapter ClpS [Betaproteobacteria bacterium]|nr:MAG: ATP-dependent Clp protease adapter ClpS [Betaproteobacteria bacterium]